MRLMTRAVVALACAASLAGCGGTKEGGLVPVSGRVTLDGGPWPKPGKITFTPRGSNAGESGQLRPASADFDRNGNFTVSSFDGNAGLYPGEYWASVECWETEPGMSNPNAAAQADPKKPMLPTGKGYALKRYESPEGSGFSVTVEPGTPVKVAFDAKSK
jgi:hypothetical protein